MDKEKLVNAVNFIAKNLTPLDRWMDDPFENTKVELDLFSLVYGWMVIKDNNIVQLTKENIEFYLSEFIMQVANVEDILDKELLFYLFSDRFKNYQNELSKIRKTQLLEKVYFSHYFYYRVYIEPLSFEELPENVEFKSDDWNDSELADMFIHQVNYLQVFFEKL
jgi:hypothetical protein